VNNGAQGCDDDDTWLLPWRWTAAGAVPVPPQDGSQLRALDEGYGHAAAPRSPGWLVATLCLRSFCRASYAALRGAPRAPSCLWCGHASACGRIFSLLVCPRLPGTHLHHCSPPGWFFVYSLFVTGAVLLPLRRDILRYFSALGAWAGLRVLLPRDAGSRSSLSIWRYCRFSVQRIDAWRRALPRLSVRAVTFLLRGITAGGCGMALAHRRRGGAGCAPLCGAARAAHPLLLTLSQRFSILSNNILRFVGWCVGV